MSRAEYNRDAINRIRAGATSADLGWDESFYIGVCRQHGLAQTRVPKPSIEPPGQKPEPKPELIAPLKPRPPKRLEGDVYFDASTGIISRSGFDMQLKRRDLAVFAILAAQPDGALAKGPDIMSGVGSKRHNAGSTIAHLRLTLRRLSLGVGGVAGRHDGGYFLNDMNTRNRVIPKMFEASGAPT